MQQIVHAVAVHILVNQIRTAITVGIFMHRVDNAVAVQVFMDEIGLPVAIYVFVNDVEHAVAVDILMHEVERACHVSHDQISHVRATCHPARSAECTPLPKSPMRTVMVDILVYQIGAPVAVAVFMHDVSLTVTRRVLVNCVVPTECAKRIG